MALLSVARRLCFIKIPNSPIKVDSFRFHTLKKIDTHVATRTAPIEFVAPKRNFFWIFRKRTKREIKLVDKPPTHYELIYRCSFDNYISIYQHVGFYVILTVCLFAVVQSHRFYEQPRQKQMAEEAPEDHVTSSQLSVEENEIMLLVGAFMFVFYLIQFFIGRMPARIYCYPQRRKYLFYFYGVIPNQLKTLIIKAGEIQPINPEKVSLWKNETYEHKETGQKFLLLNEYFRNPGDLYVMLGWQEDPDVNYDYKDPAESKNEGLKKK